MKEILTKLLAMKDLNRKEMQHVMQQIFLGKATDSEIAAFLTALRMKGETADEIATIAEVIRTQASIGNVSLPNMFDNCGTGGDRSFSFNISTTVAFVLAGAGVTVAKHGNRSVSSKTGSADVLEKLGVSLTLSNEETHTMLEENHISFLFAPHIHQSLRPFMKVRKDLGLPTVFNLIGPLTNPLPLDSQLIGVYEKNKVPLIAEALQKLGRKRAIVLHGAGGMDEASLAGENHLMLLDNGQLTSFTLTATDVGLPAHSNQAIQGGDTLENAKILRSVLRNEPSAYLDTVLLNAGIAFFANGKTPSIQAGIHLATKTIASGAAMKRLETLIHFSQQQKERICQ